jgi:hypothetical protein
MGVAFILFFLATSLTILWRQAQASDQRLRRG